MNARYYFLTMLVFLALSIIMNSVPIKAPGYAQFYDRTENIDLTSFRSYFTSLFKWDQTVDLDSIKRIFSEWVFFFMDEQQFDVIRFPLQSFLVLAVSYSVFLRFIENEKYKVGQEEKHLISAVAAFFYLVNPVAMEHYISLYPEFSYAAFPAAIYFMYMTFRSTDPKYPLLLGLISALLVGLVIHNVLYLAVSAACMAAVALACMKVRPREILCRAALAGGAFIALNMFFILPFAYIALSDKLPDPGYINAIEDILSNSRDAGMMRVMLEDIHLNYLASVHLTYPLGDLYFPAIAIMTAGVISAAIYRRNALAAAAGLNFAALALLTNGVNSPIGEIYRFAIFNLPMGWLFRQSPKFAFLMPLFFAIMLAHVLCMAARNRKLLAALCAAVILSEGIFCNIVWDGSYGGAVLKKAPNSEIVDVIEILKAQNVSGKTGWYADYVKSAPEDIWIPKGKSQVALQYLVDNPNPSRTVAQLSGSLGMEYLVIDKAPGKPYYYFGYARKAVGDLDEEFRPLYEGKRMVLYRAGQNLTEFYIPKVSMLVYSGYDAVHAISEEAPLKRDVSLIMADDMPEVANRSREYVDAAVFDSKYALPLPLEEGNIIRFGDNISGRNGRLGWAKANVKSNAFTTDWLRVLEQYRMDLDANDYDEGLVYALSGFSTWDPEEKKAVMDGEGASFGGKGNATRSSSNKRIWLSMRSVPVGGFERFEFDGRIVPTNLTYYRVYAHFLDSRGKEVKKVSLFHGTGEREFNYSASVPAKAASVQLRALARSGNASRDMALENVRIYGMTYGPNILDEGFGVQEEGEYDLYLRVFKSPGGGSVGITINGGNQTNITTRSEITGFEWVKAYSGRLGKENTIGLENNEGLNAVNIGYILKKGSEPENVLGGKGILYIYEGENDFETEGAKVSKNDKASDGLEVSLKKTSVERSALHIYESRIYHVKYAGQNVSVSIDGKEAEGGIFLEKGDHNISVKANSEGARLDYVLVMDKKMEDIFNGLSNGSLKAGGQVTGYERTGAASYIVNVSVSKPSLLVSTTGYNPLFEAEDGGALARPIPVYSTMNAFPLEPGQRTIQVRYVPQGYMDIGLVFSSLSLLAIIGYLAWRWKHG